MIVRKARKFSHMLDVGTGSGVILLSIVKAGIADRGTGSDISEEALKVSAINQRRLRLGNKTDFVKSDRFQNMKQKFDLIVSNPPYIKAQAHRSLVQSTVDFHEPHLALYLDDRSYEAWFKEFFAGVKSHLLPGGEFWMEGHELEIDSQRSILDSLGFYETKVLTDLSGMKRYLFGRV